MRRLMIAAVAAGALAIGPAAIAGANGQGPPDNGGGPGPNGPNNFGLCTAYFAGSEQGQENKRKAPPFQALEEAADETHDGDVAAWCETNAPHPSGNGNG